MVNLDTLLVNGNIYTMEEEGHKTEALGIKDGRIVFVGKNIEASKYQYKEKVDLEGKTLIPGMGDSHLHMYAYCQNKMLVNLESADSMEMMLSLLREKAETTEKGTWIKGVNFDQNKFKENRFPTRDDLDKVSKEHPIVIKRCCLHAVVANTAALEAAGVREGYRGGSGGIVKVDKQGRPNGVLREQSTKIFDKIIPDPLEKEEDKKKVMGEVFQDMVSKGITTIHTYAAKIWQYNEDIQFYRGLENRGELPVRVTACLDELFSLEELSEEEKNNPYQMVYQGGYKLFTDGSLGAGSAALQEPYNDEPQNRGFLICTQEELNSKMLEGYKRGLQPCIHAIGDRALDMTLSAIENTLKVTNAKGMSKEEQALRKPFRLIHVQVINKDLLERMKKLPVVLDIQPIFLCGDLKWIEDKVGKERVSSTYCWKTMKDAGLLETGGSDCPVEEYNSIRGIFAAVTRCSFENPEGEGFMPKERLSVYDAISLYTKNIPYATGQEHQLGTLTVGKFADIVILDRDPFIIEKQELLKIKVLTTYVGGRKVFG